MAPGMTSQIIPVLESSDSVLPVAQDVRPDEEVRRTLVLGF